MEYFRPAPVGVDLVIDRFQRDLFFDLTICFGWLNYDSYPRIYRNKRGDEVIPEYYMPTGDYKDVRFEDNVTAMSYFLIGEKRDYDYSKMLFTQDIAIIFQARLDKLYNQDSKSTKEGPCKNDRLDERLIDDIRQSVKKLQYENRLTEIITGVDKVYEGLKISYDKKYFDDMNDFAVVRFNFKMVYTNDKKPSRI